MFKQFILTAKVFIWAATFHPDFYKCSITFYRPPIRMSITFNKFWDKRIFLNLDIGIPEIGVDIPLSVINAFVEAKATEGKVIDFSDIDSIPF